VPGGTVSSVWLIVVYLTLGVLGTWDRLLKIFGWLAHAARAVRWAVGCFRRHLGALRENEAYLHELHAA
jgi:hypothetical protein